MKSNTNTFFASQAMTAQTDEEILQNLQIKIKRKEAAYSNSKDNLIAAASSCLGGMAQRKNCIKSSLNSLSMIGSLSDIITHYAQPSDVRSIEFQTHNEEGSKLGLQINKLKMQLDVLHKLEKELTSKIAQKEIHKSFQYCEL